jgi:nucleotidyltransferase/DNA polymerase involved in DNA repair
MSSTRVILHVDMDAFYAAIEVRENPELAGLPLIIGHRGPRGVVSTCSYEARRFGVHSAMPSVRAERRCPQAVWLPGRMSLYAQVSRQIRRLFDDTTPLVEPLSIDEAFLDLTGIASDLQHGARLAESLRQRIHEAQRLTASVGVAPNKFLAKIASDMDKPDGLTILGSDQIESKLWPLPIERLWGVGPRTAERLRQQRIRKVGDLLQVSERSLQRILGEHTATHLRRLARGEDDRPVSGGRDAKSVSEERTYGKDLRDPDVVDRALLARAEGVARQLRQHGLQARTVHLKVRSGDFATWTRSHTLPEATDLAEVIVEAARALLRQRIPLEGRGIRLLGVGVSGLEASNAGQGRLFADPKTEKVRRLAQTADAIRQRLGDEAVTRARLLVPRTEADDDEPPEASSLPSVD